VYVGSRADYIAARRDDATAGFWLGGFLALIGTLCAAIGLWLLWRK
jgi:hypothetical protein